MKIALLLLAGLLASDPQDPKTVTLRYADGGTTTAQVLSVDGESVKLVVSVLGGQMQVTRKLSDFAPSSIYLIEREARPPKTYDDHMKMAQRAVDLGLVTQAGNHCRAAVATAKGTPEEAAVRKQVRGWAADALEQMVKEAVAAGELRDAQHLLQILTARLPDCRSEDQLEALAAEVDALADRQREERDGKRQAKLTANARSSIAASLKPIQKLMDDADKKQREAVRKARRTVESSRLSEAAIDLYKKAWTQLQELVGKNPDDADLAREAERLGATMQTDAIRAALHAADVLTAQTDYKGARGWVDRVLEFDPDNADAKAMQRTITIAEAESGDIWNWGWRIVDQRGEAQRR